MANKNEIIVKVGNRSKLKFSHSKVYRAITANELIRLSDIHNDCNIVIIESIDVQEQEIIKQFAIDFKNKDSKNTVLFFLPEEDDITSGIADELAYDIVLTLADLYNIIYKTYDINVSTLIADKQRINSANIEEAMPEGITDIFGEMVEDEKRDIENFVANEDNINIETGSSSEVEETDKDSTDSTDSLVSKLQKETPTEEVRNILQKEETPVSLMESKDTTEANNSDVDDSALEKISSLEMQLRDAKYDYNVILKDMQEANKRITSLENVIRVVKEEKQEMLNKFNTLIEQTEVIEDPISLAQYEELRNNIENSENKIKELTKTIDKLKLSVDEKSSIIKDKDESIENLNLSIDNLKVSLKNINDNIESGEIHKDIISEYTEKLESIEETNRKLQEIISNLTDEKNSLITKTDEETKSLREEVENIEVEINNLREEKESLEIEKERLEGELEKHKSTIEKQSNEMKMLKSNAITKADEVNEANKQLKNTNAKLEKQLSDLKVKYNKRNEQYNSLVESYGINDDGASIVMETNKSLEVLVKNLQEQLASKVDEINKLRDTEQEKEMENQKYKTQCRQLQDTLKNISTGMAVTNTQTSVDTSINREVKSINYNEQSQIITVFGSGSFGITTTAMSLAYKLGMTSKVIYIDFDLVTPKADAWFSKLPLCKNVPGINIQDRRMTGLGIFYEKGFNFFKNHFVNIVNNCEKTRGGGIDYLSGVYYRVNSDKIASADYSALFNLLATQYNYIVVDLGKLGCSEVGDSLIKAIADVANRNVVVTTNDRFEIRNFRTKLIDNKIDINNIAWLLNMCESTIVDNKIKQIINPAKFGLMIKDGALQGKREKFTHTKLNKDRLELFINSVVFSN